MLPLLSIVIANYNYGRFLEDAINSVVEQDGFDRCELIVVDGGSTDNSVDVIKKFANGLPPNTPRSEWHSSSPIPHPPSLISWWCSERDKGQSDAFNKGFAHARGRLGCWVNADDLLLPGTLRAVLDCMEQNQDVEWVTGGTIYFNEDFMIWRARIGTSITRSMHRWVDPTVIGGPSSFFSIERLKEVGGFNLALHYMMDGDLWNKFFAAGMTMVHVQRYFWGFRAHSASKTSHAFYGRPSKTFNNEEKVLFKRVQYSRWGQRLRVLRLRLHKVMTGAIIRSYLDTKRYAGKNILKEFWG